MSPFYNTTIITDNNINDFNSLDPLKILILKVCAPNNIQLILDNLYKFTNLRELRLTANKITEIKGLEHLINLQSLVLSHNDITEIKGLEHLINLRKLDLSFNNITEIKGLEHLVRLKILLLRNNKITKLPLNLCNLRNINNFYFCYNNNPIEQIPLPVQRWLDRLNRRITQNNMVYNDSQNVHSHHIQNSFRNSLENLLRDKIDIDLEAIKENIVENNILTEQTKREILNYCDDVTEHSTYLITYCDLLVYVWNRINKSAHKEEILKILNQEISDGLCMCFTGRLTRLINVLVGFYSDIELQISDSEQITNIIINLKNKITNDHELKESVKKELLDRNYNEIVINEWLNHIDNA